MPIVKYAPDSWLSDEPLIDEKRLQQIKEHYQQDWQACINYVQQQNQALGFNSSDQP